MKNLDYYMNLPYKLEIIPDLEEGGYIASYPDLKGCITFAETIEEVAMASIDAKRTWLEAAIEDGLIIKEPLVRKYSRS